VLGVVLERHDEMSLRSLYPLVGNLVWRVTTALLIPSATDPDDDGQQLPRGNGGDGRFLRRPDVEVQAILALGIGILELGHKLPKDARVVAAVLIADGLVCRGVDCAGVGGPLGGHKAPRACRRYRERHAQPHVHVRRAGVDEPGVCPTRGAYGEIRARRHGVGC